jgi:hypothetical protein
MLFSLRETRMARHSWVNSSITLSILNLCVPKIRFGRSGDEVRREWDVTAKSHCAELVDA